MEYVVHLEDDAFFGPHFGNEVLDLVDQASVVPWDVISLGACWHHLPPYGEQMTANLWATQVMRCCHANLMRHSGAVRFLKGLPVQAPFDLQWNLAMSDPMVALAPNFTEAHRNYNFTVQDMENTGRIYW